MSGSSTGGIVLNSKLKNFNFSRPDFLDIQGFKLYYEVYEGLVDSDTLLIHGNLACSLWWHPAVESLANKYKQNSYTNPSASAQNHRDGYKKGKLVLADWRGCGFSKGIQSISEINFDTFADDYLCLIEKLNLNDVQVVGHSTGGLIAMLAILKQPHKFKNLVLLDSIGPLGIESPIPTDILLGHFETVSKSEELSNMTIAATIQNVDITSEYFKSLAKATFNVDKPIWRGVPEVLCTQIDITDRMQEIQIPTLILHGELDMVLPASGSEKMNQMIKNSKLKILKNHGHSFNVEDPDTFVHELESFWKE